MPMTEDDVNEKLSILCFSFVHFCTVNRVLVLPTLVMSMQILSFRLFHRSAELTLFMYPLASRFIGTFEDTQPATLW